VSGLTEEQFLLVNTSLDPDQAAAQYQGGNGFSLPCVFFRRSDELYFVFLGC
jgi:hypothetical protein